MAYATISPFSVSISSSAKCIKNMRSMERDYHLCADCVSVRLSWWKRIFTYIMPKVRATRKRSQASEIKISNEFQKRWAGPYAPNEINKVMKLAKVFTSIVAGRNRCSQTYATGSPGETEISIACMVVVTLDLFENRKWLLIDWGRGCAFGNVE